MGPVLSYGAAPAEGGADGRDRDGLARPEGTLSGVLGFDSYALRQQARPMEGESADRSRALPA